MKPVITMPKKKRKSVHEYIKEQRKKIGYEPISEPRYKNRLKVTEIHTLPSAEALYDDRPSERTKKKPKTDVNTSKTNDDIDPTKARKALELIKTYDKEIQEQLWSMDLHDMINWIFNMEKVIEQMNHMTPVTAEEVFGEELDKHTTIQYSYDVPEYQMEAYEKFLKDKKVSFGEIELLRASFLEKANKTKKAKKYNPKTMLNLYDPLFHGTEGNLEVMRANLKRLNNDNKRRLEMFLADIEKLTGSSATSLPVIKAFKDRTEHILKTTDKWLNNAGIERTDLLIQF